MPDATLTISSRNYSSWSLRGWLLCRMAGLDFEEDVVPLDEPMARAELLLLSGVGAKLLPWAWAATRWGV